VKEYYQTGNNFPIYLADWKR